MARFVFHIDGKKLDCDAIPNGAIKSLFANLRSAIDSQLKSQRCQVHRLEPTVSLFSQNDQFSGYCLGTCCQAFDEIIEPLVKVNIPGVDSSATRMVRTVKYSSIG